MFSQQTSLNLTQLIALIGCITGCLSFAINVYHLYRERYCLKINFYKPECLFFDSITIKNYSSHQQALIHLTLCNRSVNPITIHDAYIQIGEKYSRFEAYEDNPDIRLLLKHTKLPDNLIEPNIFSVFPMDKQISFPLRLQAYDSYESYGFIPAFPYEGDASVKISIIFKTAKKSKHKVHVVLHKFSD